MAFWPFQGWFYHVGVATRSNPEESPTTWLKDRFTLSAALGTCAARRVPTKSARCGGVAERLNAAVLKTVELERAPGVRIPPPPPAAQDRAPSNTLNSLNLLRQFALRCTRSNLNCYTFCYTICCTKSANLDGGEPVDRKAWQHVPAAPPGAADRMLAAGIDDRIRRDLFGHRLDRERYGKGASLDHVARLVREIAL